METPLKWKDYNFIVPILKWKSENQFVSMFDNDYETEPTINIIDGNKTIKYFFEYDGYFAKGILFDDYDLFTACYGIEDIEVDAYNYIANLSNSEKIELIKKSRARKESK